MQPEASKSDEWKKDEFVVYLAILPFMTNELLKHFYDNKDRFIGVAENGTQVDFDKIVGFCQSDPFNITDMLDASAVGGILCDKYSKRKYGIYVK